MERTTAIVFQNGVAGKICANPECGWKPISEFHHEDCSAYLLATAINLDAELVIMLNLVQSAPPTLNIIVNSNALIKKQNPRKYEEALRKYCEAQRDEINAKTKECRQQNLEHHREIGRKSREKHAEECNAYQRKYSKANRDKLTLYTNNRSARKLAAEGFHTDEDIQNLKTFYNFTCLFCGKQEPEIKLTHDHVHPLTKGRSDSIDNIQPLCARCNSKKNYKHLDYR